MKITMVTSKIHQAPNKDSYEEHKKFQAPNKKQGAIVIFIRLIVNVYRSITIFATGAVCDWFTIVHYKN